MQIGRAAGAEVTAIDVAEEKLALAKSLGAARTLNATNDDVVKELRGSGGMHVALVTSAAKSAYDMAFYCVRPTGTLLAVGLARTRNLVSGDSDGGWRDPDQGVRRRHHGKICARSWRWEQPGPSVARYHTPARRRSEVLGQLSRGEISGRVVLRLQN